jgi:hypothetical protein
MTTSETIVTVYNLIPLQFAVPIAHQALQQEEDQFRCFLFNMQRCKSSHVDRKQPNPNLYHLKNNLHQ